MKKTLQGSPSLPGIELRELQISKFNKEKSTPSQALPMNLSVGSEVFVGKSSMLGNADVDIKGEIDPTGTAQIALDIEKDNFTLDQLFKNFDVPILKEFVFDNVSLAIQGDASKEQAKSQLQFSGDLRTSSGMVKPFADFLEIQGPIRMGFLMDVANKELTEKLSIQSVQLKSAAKFVLAINSMTTINEARLTLDFKQLENGKWDVTPQLNSVLSLSQIASQEVEMSCEVKLDKQLLTARAFTEQADNMFGVSGLTLQQIGVQFQAGKTAEMALSASLTASQKDYQFSGLISETNAAVSATVTKFSLDDLQALATNAINLKLPKTPIDINFDTVSLTLAKEACEINGQSVEQGFGLYAKATVMGVATELETDITAQGIQFGGKVNDLELGPVKLTNGELDFFWSQSAQESGSRCKVLGEVTYNHLTLNAMMSFEKDQQSWNKVMYASIESDGFSLGTIFPMDKDCFANSIVFSKAALIWSSANTVTQDPQQTFSVKKGLQLMGVLDEIPALTDLTGVQQTGLILSAHIGDEVGISIAMPDTQLPLGPSVTCDPFTVGINLLPKPAFELMFGMDVKVPKQTDPLHFDVGLEISAIDATGSGTMKGYWKQPFGLKGLQIGPNLALELGINYAQFVSTGTPSSFGFAGGLVLGDITAQMALKISSDPTEEILFGEIEQLSPKNLVSFAETVSSLDLPNDAIPNFFDLQELSICIAPLGGSIGTIDFEPGISFAGNLVMFGKRIEAYTRINDDGVEASGHIDRIDLGPLSIKGQKGDDAQIQLSLTTAEQSLLIDGAIELFDSEMGTYVNVSNQGIEFEIEQNFQDLISYEILGKSKGSITKPAQLDFSLSAEFNSSLLQFIEEEVTKQIDNATKAANRDINAAKKDVEKAEKAYKKDFDKANGELIKAKKSADAYLKQCQGAVKKERDTYQKNLRQAETQVKKAQDEYNRVFNAAQNKLSSAQATYDRELTKAVNTLNSAQRNYDTAMRAAQREVDKAKRSYNGAFNSAKNAVNSARRSLSSLKSKRSKLKKKLNWTNAAWVGPQIAGVEVAIGTAEAGLATANAALTAVQKGGQYAAFESAKKVLEATRYGGKYGALEAAKGAINGIKNGPLAIAVQSAKAALNAVKRGSEFAAFESAKQALSVAKTTGDFALKQAEASLRNIASSTVYVAFEAAKAGLEAVKQGTSAIAFETAKAALEAAKASSKAVLGVAKLMAEHAGDLIDIQHIKLSSSIKKIKSGELFKASVTMSVLNNPIKGTFDFDVKEPLSLIGKLFSQAFKELKTQVA